MQFRIKPPITLALVAISLIPIVAGFARLAQIAGVPIEMMHTPRVSTGPRVALVAHIVAAIVFLSLGAFQFSLSSVLKRRRLHRNVGRIVVFAALVTGTSAVWLTIFFPHAPHDGIALNVIRVFAGCGIVTTTVLGILAIRDRRVSDHRRWMGRTYALGSATGVQAFVVIGWKLTVENPGGLTRALIFGCCWCACLLFAELQLSRTRYDNGKGNPNEYPA